MTKVSIAELILAGDLVGAKNAISEELNERALTLLDEVKAAYAESLFADDVAEEIDATFKGKTDVDKAKESGQMDTSADEAGDGGDGGDDDDTEDDLNDEDDDSEEDDNNDGGDKKDNKKVKAGKNITVNIKETTGLKSSKPSGVPVAHGNPSSEDGADGAHEMPAWRRKQKKLMNMGKVLNKTKTTGIVSEEKKTEDTDLTEEHRPLHQVAREIRKNWPKVNYAAKPYLDAMSTMNSHKDNYYQDSGKSVVAYFLSNASSYRGDAAKKHKAELKAMLKEDVEDIQESPYATHDKDDVWGTGKNKNLSRQNAFQMAKKGLNITNVKSLEAKTPKKAGITMKTHYISQETFNKLSKNKFNKNAVKKYNIGKKANLKEEEEGGNKGAPASAGWKKYQAKTMRKGPKPARVDSVVKEE